ncbi:MAG: ribbon-helix-helix domain-containing protein [Acidobacteriia bacterium]|nr:ribbon-helix-helix domain-containing protein [Terriglobia bacterium]
MIRTQIYLTSRQRDQLAALARNVGRRRSELIREAIDRFIEQHARDRRRAVLARAVGIWKDRTDLPSADALRGTWNRR